MGAGGMLTKGILGWLSIYEATVRWWMSRQQPDVWPYGPPTEAASLRGTMRPGSPATHRASLPLALFRGSSRVSRRVTETKTTDGAIQFHAEKRIPKCNTDSIRGTGINDAHCSPPQAHQAPLKTQKNRRKKEIKNERNGQRGGERVGEETGRQSSS